MLNSRAILTFLLLIASQITKADFVFNDQCVKAYNSIVSLKLNEGQNLLNAEKKIHPNNKIPYLLENYIDFFKVLTLETNESFEKLKENKSLRLEKIEDDADTKSPWYLYSQAEIYLQSCINRFKYQEYVTGAYELQKAYKMLEENKRKFPTFLPNNKSFALLYGLIGMVPDQYKWALSSIGLKGNVQEGIEMLEQLKNQLPNTQYSYLQAETIFFLSFIQLSTESKTNIMEVVLKNTSGIPNTNLLKTFIVGIVAIRTGHADEAINVLNARPKSSAYTSFYHLDYLMGLAKLSRFDDDAVQYFESYLKNYTGNFNVKDSYLKISWYYLLKGNIDKYKAYTGLCKVRGQMISEKDKVAFNNASENHAPEICLLKARLYYDGGYYDKSLNALREKRLDDIKLLNDKVEYLYRMGMVQQSLKNDDQALIFFNSAISKGRELPSYYAANAALQMGLIYERKRNYSKAEQYFNMSMKMKNEEYRASIESKAKAGIKRVSSKH